MKPAHRRMPPHRAHARPHAVGLPPDGYAAPGRLVDAPSEFARQRRTPPRQDRSWRRPHRRGRRRPAPENRIRRLRAVAARLDPHSRTRPRSPVAGWFHVKHHPDRCGCHRHPCRTHAPSDPCLLQMGRHHECSRWHRMAMRAGLQEKARRSARSSSGPPYRRAASLRVPGECGHRCPPDGSPIESPANAERGENRPSGEEPRRTDQSSRVANRGPSRHGNRVAGSGLCRLAHRPAMVG